MKEINTEEVKKIQLNILCAVDEFCRKNNIEYFLGYGTLLGAVRHKGYIPWDDDIDIVMLRKDYELFLQDFNKSREDSLQVLYSGIDHNFPFEFVKIHDTNTKLIENIGIEYDMGINIDLFVLDDVPTKEDAFRLHNKIEFACKTLSYKFMLSKSDNFIKRVAKKMVKFLANFRSVYSCIDKIDRISRSYENTEGCDYCAVICQRWFSAHEILQKDWLSKSVELEFEGCKFLAPQNYDEVLTAWYGDYMQLPPIEERVTHHDYKAYIK